MLAGSLTPADLYAAMRAQRGYATLDKNLGIRFSVNGGVMGSTLSGAASAYAAEVKVWDPDALAGRASDAVTRVEIISDRGAVVRTLTPSPAAGIKTVTWKATGLPAKARYFWVRVSTASDDVNGTARRDGLDRAGLDRSLAGWGDHPGGHRRRTVIATVCTRLLPIPW